MARVGVAFDACKRMTEKWSGSWANVNVDTPAQAGCVPRLDRASEVLPQAVFLADSGKDFIASQKTLLVMLIIIFGLGFLGIFSRCSHNSESSDKETKVEQGNL